MMINPRFLQTFLSLCATRHFTQTAAQLHMTQSGVSQHLKKLEESLGVTLFDRVGKQIEITPAGEKLRHFAQNYSRSEQVLRESLHHDSPFEGAAQIACSGSMAMQIYPALLDLQQQHEKLKIHLEAAPNSRIFDLLRDDHCDLGIVSQASNDPDFSFDLLGGDPLRLILPKGAKADWASLNRLGYINHPNGGFYAQQLLEANYPKHFKGMASLPLRGSVNQLMQILLPVSRGLGFTILPASTLTHSAYRSALTCASLDFPIYEKLYLCAKKHKQQPARTQLLAQAIKDHCGLEEL